ncbi:hypothetical protein GGI43DRAFT_412726 [Trichoderma evansii]
MPTYTCPGRSQTRLAKFFNWGIHLIITFGTHGDYLLELVSQHKSSVSPFSVFTLFIYFFIFKGGRKRRTLSTLYIGAYHQKPTYYLSYYDGAADSQVWARCILRLTLLSWRSHTKWPTVQFTSLDTMPDRFLLDWQLKN